MNPELLFIAEAVSAIQLQGGTIEGKSLEGLCNIFDRLIEDESKKAVQRG